jgi:ribonuclease HII
MLVCGIDEAGRGPLAGPVTAAAVILPEGFPLQILNDSKRMTPAARERVSRIIRERALGCSTGWAWPGEIDRLNIHRATLLAMQRAVCGLKVAPEEILVDGRFVPNVPYPCRAVVKGDASIAVIMAASIVAKTARDRWMVRYARIELSWRFDRHKGYPTAQHRQDLKRYGLSSIHRRSFRHLYP